MKTGKHVAIWKETVKSFPLHSQSQGEEAWDENSTPRILSTHSKRRKPLCIWGGREPCLTPVLSAWVESSGGSAAASHTPVPSRTWRNESAWTHVCSSSWFPKTREISGESGGVKLPSENLNVSVTFLPQPPKDQEFPWLLPWKIRNPAFIPVCQEELNFRVLGEALRSLQIQDYSIDGPTIRRSPLWIPNEIDNSCHDNKGPKCCWLNLVSGKLDSHVVPKHHPLHWLDLLIWTSFCPGHGLNHRGKQDSSLDGRLQEGWGLTMPECNQACNPNFWPPGRQ